MNLLTNLKKKFKRRFFSASSFSIPRGVESALNYQSTLFAKKSSSKYLFVVGYAPLGFTAYGKVTPDFFFPSFIRTLNEFDIDVQFLKSPQFPASSEISRPYAILNIVNEDRDIPAVPKNYLDFVCKSSAIFNPFDLLPIMSDKLLTAEHFRKYRINSPILLTDECIANDSLYFVNKRLGSGLNARLCPSQVLSLAPNEYASQFIDTTFNFSGEDYYVCIRLISVCGELVAVYPRLKYTFNSLNPSVHSKDTPLDADLVNAAYKEFIAPYYSDFHELASKIGQAFPLSFLATDVLIHKSGSLYCCETGTKFDDYGYTSHISSIQPYLIDSLKSLSSPLYGVKCANIIAKFI